MAKNAGGTATDTAVKLVLIFFISLLSFSVGTYVGKQVSDAEDRKQALEGGDYQHFTDTADVETEQVSKDENTLSEEDIASLTEEFVKAEAKNQKNEAAATDRKPAEKDQDGYAKMTHKEKPQATEAAKVEPAPSKPSKISERLAQGEAPTPDPQKVRQPASQLPSVASSAVGKYTVQVASYATESEARDHAAELTTKGFSAFYIPASVKGKTWYRVSIGLFTNQKSAMDKRKELMSQAGVTSAIVQKIIK